MNEKEKRIYEQKKNEINEERKKINDITKRNKKEKSEKNVAIGEIFTNREPK